MGGQPAVRYTLTMRIKPPGAPGGERVSKSAEDYTPRKTTTVEPYSKRGQVERRKRNDVGCRPLGDIFQALLTPLPLGVRYNIQTTCFNVRRTIRRSCRRLRHSINGLLKQK